MVVLLYIVLAPFHKSVRIGPLHYVFLGLLSLHIFVSGAISRHRLKSKALEKTACVIFSLCVFLGFIATDTLGSPVQSQVFCSAFLVVAPVIYIMSASRMIIDQLFFVVVFALFAFHFKEPDVATRDMYATTPSSASVKEPHAPRRKLRQWRGRVFKVAAKAAIITVK